MRRLKIKNSKLLATLVLLFQTVNTGITPLIAHAEERDYPEEVTIEYDANNIYNVSGVYNNGKVFNTHTAPTYANYKGKKQPVFCIEPEVNIINPINPGYEKNPLPDMPDRAKLVSILWKKVGQDPDTQAIAQKIIWQAANGYTIHTMTRPDGSTVDIPSIEAKINKVVHDYQKKPSFDGMTTKLNLGKSTVLTDTNQLNLSEFDKVVENTANIDYHVNGNQLTLSTNEQSKSGVLTLEKSEGTGTPVAYKKAGVQTVMAGAIDKPTTYTVKLDIETKGKLKITKIDKESGQKLPGTVFHLDFGGKFPTQEVTTGDDGTSLIEGIPHNTKVTITEKSVPAPYTIDSTPLSATIKAGETIEKVSKNLREKGQIVLDKKGVETGTALWNEHYSLAGNQFEIRKETIDGPIVQTITTDAKGHAETSKDVLKALELGTYYVTESKASAGFVNTFKPVKVVLAYQNQTVPISVEYVKGTNQEITGQTTLTKEDKDTGADTQGSATFKGAQYTLFYGETNQNHAKDTPVKWQDESHPEVIKGKKASEQEVTLTIDKENQVGVKHLAISNYYWKETKAPIGYTLDQKKYLVNIAKVDDHQENAVITQNVTAKEQVIRFGFDFFKFANSASGSTSSGFNDLTFKLSPIKPTLPITGADDEATTGFNEVLGFDGYGKFENIPFGDYRFEEVKAPTGFQKIQPLVIHSTFQENTTNYEASQYIFTITEEGQEDPIKVVKVPYKELKNQAFSVHLNRLILYDKPETENHLSSLATLQSGEKNLETMKNPMIVDRLSYNLNTVKKDWYVVTKIVDVVATKKAQEKDKQAEPIIVKEDKTTLANEQKAGTWEMKYSLTIEQAAGKTLVLFNEVYENQAAYDKGAKPIAIDADLNNQAQTVKAKTKQQVTIQTKAHGSDGRNTFTYGDVLAMYDDVKITHDLLDGSKEAFETKLYALLPNGTNQRIWSSGKIDYAVDDATFTKTILTEKIDTSRYPKGTRFTFTETNYDKNGKVNGEHNKDLKEQTQTLTPKEEQKPVVPQESKPTISVPTQRKASFPNTGEKRSSALLVVGFTLMFAVAGYYVWRHRD
ncbi:LPXTG cell wall anchor domain-containing protein [Enterococcus faecalis]|nr:LPXTG cell wall anchor domain-containing protein [Enterococcus faecalis]